MARSIVWVPVTCQFCQRVSQIPFTRAEIEESLRSTDTMTLVSPCHNFSWTASPDERRTMRRALSAKSLSARR